RAPHAPLARLPEVDAAGELANEENIHPFEELGFERRGRDERRLRDDGAEIGEELQLAAQPEEGLLGTDAALWVVPLRSADGTEQDGVAGFGELQALGGERGAVAVDSAAADEPVAEVEGEAELLGAGRQHRARLCGHLRADAVAGENGNRRSLH